MYCAYGKRVHWRVEVLDIRHGTPGIRQATLRFSGKGTDRLQREAGVHAVQHLTRSRKKDRIHTSTASIAVFPESKDPKHPLRLSDVRVDTFRGSGAGGQHRNVTDSAVRVTHKPSGLTAVVTSGRSQQVNREQALAVLEARLTADRHAEAHGAVNRTRQAQIAGASRSATSRVYDRVRDMIRCKDGTKVRGVEAVLAGDLDRL